MGYKPPKDIWDVNEILRFDEPLPVEDERYVDTEEGRGNFNFRALFRSLSVDERSMCLVKPPQSRYLVFCGHRGSGKSTELKRIGSKLDGPDLFFVVEVDATRELDVNNLQYPDILMALAKALFERLDRSGVSVNPTFLTRLEIWFGERIEKHEQTKHFASEIKAGAKAETGIPFIGKLFASLTNSFKINSTYKDELRTIIKNNFTEFAEGFNQLIQAAERGILQKKQARKLLFIVDGTDRLRGDDSKRFFIEDAHQLQQIKGNFIYCCPIHLLHEGNQIQQVFKHIVLPMVKLVDADKRNKAGYRTLRNLVLKRADISLFDSEKTLERAIEFSGGNPRELLRILQTAFTLADKDQFDSTAIEQAIHELAVDFKRFLEPEDYRILYGIDHDEQRGWDPQRVNFLLYNLALLEYNSFWRRSHPVIRLLEDYRKLGSQDGKGERT